MKTTGTSKAIARRLHDGRFISRYFIGNGIDIGCGNDPISLYGEFFPLMRSLKPWDLPDGDAQFLDGVADHSFDFVHSSHCLEHMRNPEEALMNWFRVLKPNGHLVLLIPDEDLYEMGVFPSTYNSDHKWTFTIWKENSWCDKSINVVDLIKTLGAAAQVIKIDSLDAQHRFGLPRMDQTLTPVAECAIEIIIRKRPENEVIQKGRMQAPGQLTKEGFFSLTGIRLA
jgi:SAM-dependent methyltransferase